MIGTASVISWPGVLKTKLIQSFGLACRSFDINLEHIPFIDGVNTSASSHFKAIQQNKNCIAWVCFYPSEAEQKRKVNILFLENGILDRSKSYYLDDNGYGQYSNIVALRENVRKFPQNYVDEVYAKLANCGWKQNQKVIKDRIIMAALQARKNEDTILLKNCEKYLSKNTKVIIRGHPRDRQKIQEIYAPFCQRNPSWEIDFIDNPFDSLSRCGALVLNSSSMMYKALYMGIPVAAFVRSFHSGSAAVLDCSRNPHMLTHIFDFRHNQDYAERLICAINYHSISANSTVDEVLANTNFGNWLRRFRY
jgi:hypothetical protein